MKKLAIIFLMYLGMCGKGYAQHFPIYSQYMMNGLAINPAYAGSRDVLSATLLYRQQWVGFEGAPSIFSLGAHMPFRNQKVAIGVQVLNESISIDNNTGLFGSYAYRIQIGNGKLAFGLKAGFNLVKELESKITLQNPGSDNVFNNANETSFMPNFGAGLYYSTSRYFAGLSLPSVVSYSSYGKSATTGIKSYNILLTAGYLARCSDQFKIKPSTLVKYKYQSSPQVDVNLNLIFFKDDILWLGSSYRLKEAMVFLLEVQVSRKFRMGYSYDYSIGPLSKYNSGSHEIMIRYEWRDKVNTLNPLYF